MTVSVSYNNQAPYKWNNKKEVVTAREGADVEMVEETLRHFRYAVKVLELGGNETPAAQPRTQCLPSDEPRVVVWGDVLVKVGDTMHLFSINQCTEDTHAQDIVNQVWMLAQALALDEDNSNLPSSKPAAQPPPAPAAQPQPAAARAATPMQVPLGGITPVGSFDNKLKEDYLKHGVIEVNLSKIAKTYDRKGTLTYELYSTFGDALLPSKFPAVRVYSDNKFLPAEVRDYLEALPIEAGEEMMIDGTFTASVRAKGESVYYNVTAISADAVQEPDDDFPPMPDDYDVVVTPF